LKIAFYTPWVPLSHPKVSGDVVIGRNLVTALERQGHTVQLLPDFSGQKALSGPLEAPGIVAALRSARRVAAQLKPDIWLSCYCDSEAPDILGPTLAHGLGARYVIYGAVYRGGYQRLRRRKGRIAHLWSGLPGFALNLRALRAADRVIVNKRGDLEGYSRVSWLRPKLSMLTPGISTEEFRPDPELRALTRTRLGLDDRTVVLLAASRLTYRGGGRKLESVRFAIDCFSDLCRDGQDVTLLVAGDGKARPELEAHARETGFRVRFVGAVAHIDMSAIYNAADIFMFPGLREPIGMVYLEAQACGLPVVAFRNKGIPDVVRDGETGFLVPALDRELFGERLRSLTTDTELRKSLGHMAVSFIRENHDLDRWGQALSRELLASASL